MNWMIWRDLTDNQCYHWLINLVEYMERENVDKLTPKEVLDRHIVMQNSIVLETAYTPKTRWVRETREGCDQVVALYEGNKDYFDRMPAPWDHAVYVEEQQDECHKWNATHPYYLPDLLCAALDVKQDFTWVPYVKRYCQELFDEDLIGYYYDQLVRITFAP